MEMVFLLIKQNFIMLLIISGCIMLLGNVDVSQNVWQQGTCFSYDDHRIAMTLAIAGMAGNGVEIEQPDCVAISYPSFYEEMAGLY